MRTKRISPTDAAARASHARSFLAAAELVDELGPDAGIEDTTNLVGSLSVLAGIAAADAICGRALGERSGENHHDAITLLKRATPPGDGAAAQLKRLLDAKSTAQYSPLLLSDARAAELLTSARRLVLAVGNARQ